MAEVPVDLGLLEEKEDNEVDQYKVQRYISRKYKGGIIIYTDASKKTDTKMGIAYVIPQLNIQVAKRISDDLAVYTAELLAIWLALMWVESNRPKQAVIASDSSSALTSLKFLHSETRQDIVYEIMQLANNLIKSGISTTFIWVPAHIGVGGNELADMCAKKAAELPDIEVNVAYSKAEVKSIIKAKTKEKWQFMWDNEQSGRHLYKFQREVGKNRNTCRNKQEEDVLSRMRLGHTGLNRTLFIMKKHVDGMCEYCNSQETIEHVIMYCPKYHQARQRLISQLNESQMTLNLQLLLQRGSENICFQFLFPFLKITGLFKRI